MASNMRSGGGFHLLLTLQSQATVVDERPDREYSGGTSHFKIPVKCLIVLYLM